MADSASRVPPVPGHHPPGSMEKINVVQFPARHENYTTLNAMLSNRRICKNHIAHGHARARAPTSDTGRDGRPRPSAHRRAEVRKTDPTEGAVECSQCTREIAREQEGPVHWVHRAISIGCKLPRALGARRKVHPMQIVECTQCTTPPIPSTKPTGSHDGM